jgi:hypothetical protein
MFIIGCEIFRTVALLAAAVKETGEEIPGGKRSFLEDERLAFRPKDAKKLAPLVDTDGTNERTDEGGVPLVTLELESVV